jgi:hypothetical protein
MGTRKRPLLTLALIGVLGLSVTAVAIAKKEQTKIVVGNLSFTVGGGISPDKLPRNEYVPVTADLFGKIAATNGGHPPAFREFILDVDKDFKVNVKGLPVCNLGKIEATNTSAAEKACGNTELGSGIAHAEIAFPEQNPIKVSTPIEVFNGGEKGGKVKLLIHTFLTVPVPAAVVTQVTIQRKGSGLHSIAKIPAIAGGSGSAVDYSFKLGRTWSYKGRKVGYLEARCPDGVFKVSSPKTVFKNEANTPGFAPTTVLHGSVALPCAPKG